MFSSFVFDRIYERKHNYTRIHNYAHYYSRKKGPSWCLPQRGFSPKLGYLLVQVLTFKWWLRRLSLVCSLYRATIHHLLTYFPKLRSCNYASSHMTKWCYMNVGVIAHAPSITILPYKRLVAYRYPRDQTKSFENSAMLSHSEEKNWP